MQTVTTSTPFSWLRRLDVFNKVEDSHLQKSNSGGLGTTTYFLLLLLLLLLLLFFSEDLSSPSPSLEGEGSPSLGHVVVNPGHYSSI